jgi:transglutaminase-like putative cysteine protease
LDSFDQRVLSAELTVSPEPAMMRHIHDLNGAAVGVVRFRGRSDVLRFESRVDIEHTPHEPFDLEGDKHRLGKGRFAYAPDEAAHLTSSIALRHPEAGAEVEAWARRFVLPVGKTRISTVLSKMTHAVREEFQYGKRLQGAPQSPAETLARGGGSCRDYAVLMIEAARSLGLAARFVSGYIYSGSPKASTVGGGHTHAWVRVYLPDCGWADFDPTNGIVGSAGLIRTAVAVDPIHALPLHGSWSGLASDYLGMEVEVEVSAQGQDRATAPARLRAQT